MLVRKNRKAALVLLLLLALAIAAVVSFSMRGSAEQTSMPTAAVSRGDIEKTVLATGILKPSLQVNVGAQVNGQLTRLYVKQGDRVTKGQLLAEIDPTLQENEVRKSQAQLQSAVAQKQASEASLQQYQLELKRQRQLDREGAGVKSDLEKAQAQYSTQIAQVRMNEAQIVQMEMALETARANLGYTRILAPIDGEVLGIVTKEGQTIVSSQSAPTILVLANADTMTVHTRISETDILKVRVGQPLWFYVVADPKRRYDSVMGSIQEAPNEALREDSPASSSSQQPTAVYYNGVFAIANLERQLRTSMTAQVFIITAQEKNVLRIPLAALGQPQGRERYQVQVKRGATLEARTIVTGISDRQFIEVKSGLKEGENVVLTQIAGGQ
ncbi:RND family efflux transporter, MFP subunit [Serratia sp. FGI94]|nr:RND family efflux transporter, MFP subunit [Serratia sp. FGI94]